MAQFNSVHPLVIDILEWLYLLRNRGKNVEFCWVPAHVGIGGNEKADALAKEALGIDPRNNIALPVKDIYPIIRSVLQDVWNFSWELENQKMKDIANTSRPWKYPDLPRNKEVILCRLRIGHTRFTHGFLMCGEPQPFCDDCLVPLTVKHFYA